VKCRSKEGVVRIMKGDVAIAGVDTGPEENDEIAFIVFECGEWCKCLGDPTLRLCRRKEEMRDEDEL